MLDWFREHIEWVAGTLGGLAAAATAWCLRFVRKVGQLGYQMAELDRTVKEHVSKTDPLRERFILLEAKVDAMGEDITEGKTAHKELVEEVRQDREEARRERKEMMRYLRTINQNMQDGFNRVAKKE